MKYLIALNIALIAILGILVLLPPRTIVWVADRGLVVAIITAYSELDSCHYPVKGGCLTASGTIASETTIACPRSWPLGTKVLIEDKEYTCEDRYNKNLSDRIDKWVGYGKQAHKDALEFGLQKQEVVIR